VGALPAPERNLTNNINGSLKNSGWPVEVYQDAINWLKVAASLGG